MSVTPAGTAVPYRVTYLAMEAAPTTPAPALPTDVRLEVAKNPPTWFFLALYGAVGRMYEWVDMLDDDTADVRSYVAHPDVEIAVAYRYGWPQGFFLLDWRVPGICDLGYFGLVPEAVGDGIGGTLLKIAIETGWARNGVTQMTVNTCTLDHPRALALYQRHGFVAVSTQDHTRVLTRDRDPARFPA